MKRENSIFLLSLIVFMVIIISKPAELNNSIRVTSIAVQHLRNGIIYLDQQTIDLGRVSRRRSNIVEFLQKILHILRSLVGFRSLVDFSINPRHNYILQEEQILDLTFSCLKPLSAYCICAWSGRLLL
jgi:hypothetical protein